MMKNELENTYHIVNDPKYAKIVGLCMSRIVAELIKESTVA